MSESTPLMKQYREIKVRYPEAILFFRMGDFYEMFGDDAVAASEILQIALTSRDKGKKNPVPMCGIPYHAAENYLTKLISAGKRVAICEQVEDPKQAKGLVKREVVRVATPGTYIPESLPVEGSNKYILCLYPRDNITGIAFADLSTGEFGVFETTGSLEDEMTTYEPSEILFPAGMGADLERSLGQNGDVPGRTLTAVDDTRFDYASAHRLLTSHFEVESLSAFGIEGMILATSAAGGLLDYLVSTQKSGLEHIRGIVAVERHRFMELDSVSQQNLELVKNLHEGSSGATLFGVLNRTRTAMGGRLFRRWLLRPLLEPTEINARLDSVSYLKDDPAGLEELRGLLGGIPDLERLISRVTLGICSARDLVAIKEGLESIPAIKETASAAMERGISGIGERMDELTDIRDLIGNTIVDSPPVSVREGGLIREGYSTELDELRNLSGHGRDYLSSLEAREREETGISSIKVSYNRVFGYFIEVPKTKADMVPPHYVRKQTLVGSERYVTDELKKYEDRILGAEEKIKALEYGIFLDIRETVALTCSRLQSTAGALAELDVLASMAHVARQERFARPEVTNGDRIWIEAGRHPVVESINRTEKFTPNDALLDGLENRLLILTGPNMAGKSTYMRQVALITLMAQIGSFVPADSAEIGVVDRIFTRIGASDRLVKGQSTFMVEMTETASILRHASKRSLILLDEVGRGTSTFDGISIAWAVAERICRVVRARTLFATHYHELTEISMVMDGVKNYNIVVKEWGDEIIFLRKIREGPADKSYGIQVGRLAGLPEDVIIRAKEVLSNLEKAELNEVGRPKLAYSEGAEPEERHQLDLFTTQPDPVVVELLGLDIARLTPIEALNKLYEFQCRAEKNKEELPNSEEQT